MSFRYRRKSLDPSPPQVGESYFASCERDEQGHCLPKAGGAGGASGAGGAKKATRVSADEKTRKAASKLFGRDLTDEDFHALATAPDGASVRASMHGGTLSLVGEKLNDKGEPEFNSCRQIYKPWFGPLTCKNLTVRLSGAAQGQGAELLHEQVKTLHKMGVKKLTCNAAGGPDGGGVGYYVWPRCGYSGTLSNDQVSKLPKDIQQKLGKSREVLDLFQIPGGGEAWKKYGSGINNMKFDTAPDSRSMQILNAYVEEKKQRRSKQ